MRKKSIVSLIILILIILMVADFKINGNEVFESYFRQMKTESMEEIGNSGYEKNPSVSKNSNLVIDSTSISLLKIDNVMGSVEVTGEERTDIKLEYEITVYADKESQAQEFIKNLEVKSKISEHELEYFLERVKIPAYVRGIRVDYKIKAPESLALNIKNNYGRLKVDNFANDVVLSNYYDSIIVRNIQGKAAILARYGNLFVDNIQGKTEIKTAYNKAVVSNLANDLSLKSSHSDVEIENISGKADLVNKYGKVWLKGVGDHTGLESQYTDLRVSDLKGKLSAEMRYGNLYLSNVINDVEVRADYTDLNLYLAQDIEDYILDCKVSYGNISSDVPLSVNSDEHKKELKGKVGTGDFEIKLETKHGDIAIHE